MDEQYRQKKAYLERYQALEKKIGTLAEERARLLSMAAGIAPSYSHTPGTKPRGADRIQTAVDRLGELEDAIEREARRYAALRQEIARAIETVGDARLEEVLYRRYIDPKTRGQTWRAIGRAMGYTEDHAKRLHGWAIARLRP